MTNAEATLKSSILAGLSVHAHLSGIHLDRAGNLPTSQLITDLMEAIFDPSVRWAVRAYTDELEQASAL